MYTLCALKWASKQEEKITMLRSFIDNKVHFFFADKQRNLVIEIK
jgi:hypothetical protein